MTVMKSSGNYSRFWSAFHRLTLGGNDAAGVKEILVRQYTDGRTEHLHEMRECEYVRLCEAVERDVRKAAASKREPAEPREKAPQGIRSLRSLILVEMRHWGVRGVYERSVDWRSVDSFCLDRRIAGKRFCLLNEEELVALLHKLKAMNKRHQDEGC